MQVSPDELKHRMDRFQDELRRSEVKLTHQRLEIFREVAGTSDHPDAETIYKGVRKRLPTVSLDTVYRTLWLLHDFGLVTTFGSSRDRARFDANMSSHHHFVCSECGMTRDFSSDEFDQLKVPDKVKAIGDVRATQVEVRGVCLACANNKVS